jgi:glycerophosphoryl diester phosphodiesterase
LRPTLIAVLLVAHRTPGSRAACARLAAAGARLFEVDVQLAQADQIVVSHFLPFGRVGLVQRDNWRLRWHTAARRDPALVDAAAVVPGQCRVLLDLKERTAHRRARLCAALMAALPEPARFVVCGPFPEDLDRLRAAGFGTWRTAGTARELAAVLADGRTGDDAVTVRHTLLTEEVVCGLHRLAPAVVAWTVNSVARAQRLRAMGVDGVTTDRPAVLRALRDRC